MVASNRCWRPPFFTGGSGLQIPTDVEVICRLREDAFIFTSGFVRVLISELWERQRCTSCKRRVRTNILRWLAATEATANVAIPGCASRESTAESPNGNHPFRPGMAQERWLRHE